MARDKDKITSRLMFIDFRGSVNVAPRHTQSNGCRGGGGPCLKGDCETVCGWLTKKISARFPLA